MARRGRDGPLRRQARAAVRLAERFWALVDQRGPDDCWPWIGEITRQGYGLFLYQPYPNRVRRLAHCVADELATGAPIDQELVRDHSCHTRDLACPGGPTCPHRRCCNPAHLEPVTNRVNVISGRGISALNASKTHCVNGHEFTPENTAPRNRGQRRCRQCSRENSLRHHHRNREAVNARKRARRRAAA